MSKIYSDQVRKAEMLASALKKNFSAVASHGITDKMIVDLSESSQAVDSLNKEIEGLREEIGRKVFQITRKVDEMKKSMQKSKQIIKRDFDQTEWQRFGILDKR
jgi:predicted secreted Zn-dependent protease